MSEAIALPSGRTLDLGLLELLKKLILKMSRYTGGGGFLPVGIPSNAYVAEDGTTAYVAEDGVTFYTQE
jgi:hypothetical protein